MEDHASIVSVPNVSAVEQIRQQAVRPVRRVLLSADVPEFSQAQSLHRQVHRDFDDVVSISVSKKDVDRRQVVREQLQQQFDMIVLLAHGQANRFSPDSSSLRLAVEIEETGKIEYVNFSVHDLNNVHLGGDPLVMLIGCETADGKAYGATGLWGLKYKFLTAGASSVWANLWKVGEQDAIAQANDFLKQLAKGQSPRAAFAKSMKSTLDKFRNSDFHNSKPFPYWAAPVYYERGLQSNAKS